MLATVLGVLVVGATRVVTFEDTGLPVLSTVLIAGIPVSVAIAVLRHRLLDIRLIWSRTVTYLLLTAAVVVLYVGVVELVEPGA